MAPVRVCRLFFSGARLGHEFWEESHRLKCPFVTAKQGHPVNRTHRRQQQVGPLAKVVFAGDPAVGHYIRSVPHGFLWSRSLGAAGSARDAGHGRASRHPGFPGKATASVPGVCLFGHHLMSPGTQGPSLYTSCYDPCGSTPSLSLLPLWSLCVFSRLLCLRDGPHPSGL